MTNIGIIYLLQPAELIGTNRYKIGCSKSPTLKRCNDGYKCGTRYLCIMECNEPHILEKYLISIFNKNYKKIAGNEYFEINENETFMLKLFIDSVYEYIYNPSIIYNFSNYVVMKNYEEDYKDNNEIYIIFNLIYLNDKKIFKKYLNNIKKDNNYLNNYIILDKFNDELINIIFDLEIFKYINSFEINNEDVLYKFINNNNKDIEYKCIKLINFILFNAFDINFESYCFDNEQDILDYEEYEREKINIEINYEDIIKYSDIQDIIITNRKTEEGYFNFKQTKTHKKLYPKDMYQIEENLYELLEINKDKVISNKSRDLRIKKINNDNNKLYDKIFISEYKEEDEIEFNIEKIVSYILKNKYKSKINKYKLMSYEYCISDIENNISIFNAQTKNVKKLILSDKIFLYRLGYNFNITNDINIDIIQNIFNNVLSKNIINGYKQFTYNFLTNRNNTISNVFITDSNYLKNSFTTLVDKLGINILCISYENINQLNKEIKDYNVKFKNNDYIIRNELIVIYKNNKKVIDNKLVDICNKNNYYNIIIMNNTKNNEIKNKFDNYTTNNIDYIKQYYSNNKINNNNYDIEQILTFSDLLLNNYLIWCCSNNEKLNT